jgi:hypothetical protein
VDELSVPPTSIAEVVEAAYYLQRERIKLIKKDKLINFLTKYSPYKLRIM